MMHVFTYHVLKGLSFVVLHASGFEILDVTLKPLEYPCVSCPCSCEEWVFTSVVSELQSIHLEVFKYGKKL
jgi:hypothetical protein